MHGDGAHNSADRWVGRRLGAYEILALMGRGSTGEVYRARRVDAEYEKEVAIKLAPAANAGSLGLERLRIERQVLARLDHPNIAGLIDGGVTADGLPYLIMDLVEGEPIDEYCEQRQLSIRERLRLFREVCSAVSYAHQHLIVHGDLKPGNILVSADGKVKLPDFGTTKLMQPDAEDAASTPTAPAVDPLTLQFASPEQVLGRAITTVSDVYSLGVLLCLLLTRRMPSAATNAAAAKQLDRDLDAITSRALRKEPDKRYQSVEELSQDLARYLDGYPVNARGDQLAYRAGKFLQRHTAGMVVSFLICLALVGGIIIWTYQARLAARETARAERHVATVRAFADAAMFQMHDAIKDLPGATAGREMLVSTALAYLNALGDEADKDQSLQRELAIAYSKVADIQGRVNKANLGNPTGAMQSYARAIALLEPIVAANGGDTSARSSLAHSYLQQSRLLAWSGDPKKAVALSGKATGIFESLAHSSPNVATRTALADACRVHGINLVLEGSLEPATRSADRAVAILEELQQTHEGDLELQYALGAAYASAADVYQSDSRPTFLERSNDLRLEALAVNERLVAATGGRNASYIRALFADRVNLCGQYSDSGDYRSAIRFCRAAQPLLETLRTDENNAQIELDGTNLRLHLGDALIGVGRLNEAALVFDDNVRALRNIAAQGNTLQVEYLLAASEQALGHIEEQQITSARLSRADQLRRWRRAKDWYEAAVPRFEHVASKLALTEADLIPSVNAAAGLERSKAQIARLEATRDR